jgi:hypothetical protein
MDEKYSDLAKDQPEVAVAVTDELRAQARESLNKMAETDKWLTQSNLLVNAGGAAAVLGYLGTNPAACFAVVVLGIFLLGMIASGIEIRGLLDGYKHLHKDAIRRLRGFLSEELTARDVANPQNIGKRATRMNMLGGIFSQIAFAVGAIVGIIGYLIMK